MVMNALVFPKLARRVPLPLLALFGALFLGLGNFLIPLGTNIGLLALFVLVMGAGGSFCTPIAPALISNMATKKNVGTMLSYNQISDSVARMLGPLVLGYAYATSFALPFYLGGLSAAVAVMTSAILFFMDIKKKVIPMQEKEGEMHHCRGPTKHEVHQLGHFLSALLSERGYAGWAEHQDEIKAFLSDCFPVLESSSVAERRAEIADIFAKQRIYANEFTTARLG